LKIAGGATSGDGITITTVSGNSITAPTIQGDLGGRVLGNTTTPFSGVGAIVSSASGGAGTQAQWNFKNSTALGDPGTGNVRFNAATATATTALYISSTTDTGFDFANYFRSFSAGDSLTIQDTANANSWAKYTLAAAPQDQTGWWIVQVTFVSASGTMVGNNDNVDMLWRQQAPPSPDPWAQQLPSVYIAGSAGYILGTNLDMKVSQVGGVIGPGGSPVTIHAQDLGGNPLAGAYTWITTDPAGNNKIAGTLPTDTFGNVDFALQPGDYYAWMQKPNYTLTNPTAITVT
jgi:hypothetical protein